MASSEVKNKSEFDLYVVGILGWLFPGAGHWYLGERFRGGVMFVSILTAFLLGVMLGGTEMIGPQESKPWFCAQVLSGLPALVFWLVENGNVKMGYGRGVDLGQVYTGVAGMLNLLCVLDAVLRAQGGGISESSSVGKE